MKILGAGLAGLLAANMLRKSKPVVYEAAKSLPNNHTALLRHRELKISEATSIPFKKVTVTKSINYKGQHYSEPNIFFSNMYSKKVIGSYLNRSISNLKPVERYIAPPNFISQLAMGCDIEYDRKLTFGEILDFEDRVISTIPMPIMWEMSKEKDIPEFEFREITVATAYIENCEVYQTIYYPNPSLQLYRMSITGNKVILEFVGSEINFEDIGERHGVSSIEEYIIHFLERDFGMYDANIADVSINVSKYGKIKEINDAKRKEFMRKLTSEHQIYSLGRFATWRNILLDDVHNDVLVIKNLMASNGYYTGDSK